MEKFGFCTHIVETWAAPESDGKYKIECSDQGTCIFKISTWKSNLHNPLWFYMNRAGCPWPCPGSLLWFPRRRSCSLWAPCASAPSRPRAPHKAAAAAGGAAARIRVVLDGWRAGSSTQVEKARAAFIASTADGRGSLSALHLFPKHYWLRLLSTNFTPKLESNRLLQCSKKDINWFWDWLDNHLHRSFINIAIIWHLWMEEDCKVPADPVKHVKWRLVLLLSLSLVKDN